MAEILSQQEIDALLNNIKSGQDQTSETNHEQEAVLFDFRLPNRISKNQLRIIRSICDNFAESFSSFLVTKLQSAVSINVASIDQIYYSEYVLIFFGLLVYFLWIIAYRLCMTEATKHD